MITWKKSSRSSTNNDCVEVANSLTAVRDSKCPTVVLPVDRGQLDSFLAGAKSGRFDN